MKKELTPTTTKGELLEDKKWVIEERNGKIFIEETGFNDGETYAVEVCQMHGNDKIDKEDATLICQAVNERQKLLDSNRELLEALEHAENVLERLSEEYLTKVGKHSSYTNGDYSVIKKAKNNAKNLQP